MVLISNDMITKRNISYNLFFLNLHEMKNIEKLHTNNVDQFISGKHLQTIASGPVLRASQCCLN